MVIERVPFEADGLTLVGELHRPDGDPHGTLPGIVLTGPFTGVKEQVVGTYARRLAEAGFAALAFDHRGFGESAGRRQHEDAAGKLSDLRAAVRLLAAHPAVDAARLGLLGICLGGGYAVRAAAFDPRVQAVAGVAGAYNSPAAFAAGMGADAYRKALAGFLEADPDARMAAVSPDGPAAMGGREPWEYYGTERSASPHWVNEVTVASLYELMTLDTLSAADLLARTPLLVVHGTRDDYCSPAGAQAVFDRATGPKALEWIETTNHIELYDSPPHLDAALARLVPFFERELAPASALAS
ncbi:alpha/beta hydrolase [Blastococcus deserti]|uniref:Alpha/beta hydrolase n=1 Tax=Blastococcus deserti TaxID=2259033 RepID=A0ABW4XD46_9ACTN